MVKDDGEWICSAIFSLVGYFDPFASVHLSSLV